MRALEMVTIEITFNNAYYSKLWEKEESKGE